jgi:glutathione synthase
MTKANPMTTKHLTVAVQMDPMRDINIAGDSSFALMLSAQAHGFTLYHYDVGALTWADNRLTALAHPVTVQRVAGDHFTFGEPVKLDLGADVDVILMRQDPPFDLGYITATHLLERIKHQTLILNDPTSVRNAPEKVMVLDFAQYMPPTMITRSLDEVRAFHAEHRQIVIKPLHGNAGSAVMYVGEDGKNIAALTELFGEVWREPFMVQAFLKDVAGGDKRIVLVDGEVAGAINRIPGKGEIRSNLAAGGHAEATTLTDKEREICAAMGPMLKEKGLIFVGIDVIGGQYLTEINVTSPTGIVAIDHFNGTDTPKMIWDAVQRRLDART